MFILLLLDQQFERLKFRTVELWQYIFLEYSDIFSRHCFKL